MLMFAFAGILVCSFGASQATGPLKVHPDNPRYFADGSGEAIYLTGAHTWSNLKDMGRTDPPTPFDFDAYLDFLEEHNHNFIRLWAWDLSKCRVGETDIYTGQFPWKRSGPPDWAPSSGGSEGSTGRKVSR